MKVSPRRIRRAALLAASCTALLGPAGIASAQPSVIAPAPPDTRVIICHGPGAPVPVPDPPIRVEELGPPPDGTHPRIRIERVEPGPPGTPPPDCPALDTPPEPPRGPVVVHPAPTGSGDL